MDTDDFDRFAELLGGVFELYGREASPFAMQVWWEALRPFDFSAAKVRFPPVTTLSPSFPRSHLRHSCRHFHLP